jgi:hypothetical protein
MITRRSTQEEISSYIAIKSAEFMALVDERQQINGREYPQIRQDFLESLNRYLPSRTVVVDQTVKWLDDQIGQAHRMNEMARSRAAR